ncbi:MAG: hypothetical protein MHM6MM_000881 [Cercozoa sp. M6MM]
MAELVQEPESLIPAQLVQWDTIRRLATLVLGNGVLCTALAQPNGEVLVQASVCDGDFPYRTSSVSLRLASEVQSRLCSLCALARVLLERRLEMEDERMERGDTEIPATVFTFNIPDEHLCMVVSATTSFLPFVAILDTKACEETGAACAKVEAAVEAISAALEPAFPVS